MHIKKITHLEKLYKSQRRRHNSRASMPGPTAIYTRSSNQSIPATATGWREDKNTISTEVSTMGQKLTRPDHQSQPSCCRIYNSWTINWMTSDCGDPPSVKQRAAVVVFLETFNNYTLDNTMQLNRLTLHQADRAASLATKTRGGMFVYINKAWRPYNAHHYWSLWSWGAGRTICPGNLHQLIIAAVYILRSTTANDALNELHTAISEQQTKHPDGFVVVSGELDHKTFKSVLTKFHQNVNFATRGYSVLDMVYTQTKRNAQNNWMMSSKTS